MRWKGRCAAPSAFRGSVRRNWPGVSWVRHSGTGEIQMKRYQLLALAACLAASTASAGRYDSSVTIQNRSSWDIHQLFLSAVDENEWGPDQLGRHVIGSGANFELTGIPCDDYDVRLVDEDGDVCIVGGVSLCGDDDAWRISDDELLSCQMLTDE